MYEWKANERWKHGRATSLQQVGYVLQFLTARQKIDDNHELIFSCKHAGRRLSIYIIISVVRTF